MQYIAWNHTQCLMYYFFSWHFSLHIFGLLENETLSYKTMEQGALLYNTDMTSRTASVMFLLLNLILDVQSLKVSIHFPCGNNGIRINNTQRQYVQVQIFEPQFKITSQQWGWIIFSLAQSLDHTNPRFSSPLK